MIYDYEGNALSDVYDCEGSGIASAYDVDGEQVYPYTEDLVVMTYNVQWFTGINSQSAMLAEIFGDNDPDIIGFQEISRNSTLPTVGANALSDYSHIELSNHYNYNGLASKLTMSNVSSTDYQTQDTYDTGNNETRCYMKAYITVKGKQVCWFNTHLAYKTASARYAQITELFELAEEEDYVIITGDMNGVPLSTSDADYINMFKQFVDAGYKLANCSPRSGFTKTWSTATNPQSLADLTNPYDNIIVSPNIELLEVDYVLTKFDYLNGSPYDHTPIVAKLSIN